MSWLDGPGCPGCRETGGEREAKDPGWNGGESGAFWEKAGWLAALREDDRKRREREKAGWIMAYWESHRICQGKNSDG